jgi:hypothetical protein
MKMKCTISRGAVLLAIVLFATSCNKSTDAKLTYQSAIDDYYKAHPTCLWSESKKFPVQAATSDDAKTEGYDALTDAGELTRTTAEKKVFIVASKQVNNYDISDQGRSNWKPDPSQPGYGNFCFGNRDVTSIDSFHSSTNSSGTQTALVNYHYKISNVAPWANSQEMRTAFPSLDAALSGPISGQDTVVQNGSGWQVAKE